MSRKILFVVVCFVALEHKHVLGEVVLRDLSNFKSVVLQPLSAVLCPWKPLNEEETSQTQNEATNGNSVSWCGTTEENGGLCNAKCSDNILDGYLDCARQFKNDGKTFIDSVMKWVCKNKQTT